MPYADPEKAKEAKRKSAQKRYWENPSKARMDKRTTPGICEVCGIEYYSPNEGRIQDGLACMVDASPPLGARNTGGVTPERDFLFVADHHTGLEEVQRQSQERGVRSIRHAFIGLPVGSTSAFMAAIGLAFGVWDDIGPRGRAAREVACTSTPASSPLSSRPRAKTRSRRFFRTTPTPTVYTPRAI